ncbi:MAG: hypothetical protein IJU81_03660 [Bacteroidales bacterium]|nr:hypothetical protein [Bacteroidales bacterium]
MEKRIGTITMLVQDRTKTAAVNSIISDFSHIIMCRQGLPFRDRNVAVISLIVEGSVDDINNACGKLGRIDGVESKAVVTKLSAKI